MWSRTFKLSGKQGRPMSDTDTGRHIAPSSEAAGGTTAPPPPPSDDENPALIDAFKTYRYTVLGALGFVAAAVFIILSTRLG